MLFENTNIVLCFPFWAQTNLGFLVIGLKIGVVTRFFFVVWGGVVKICFAN